ncbi:uncharacterized protein LOC106398645 isoform X1 [Brassica napus]|uniref:uncharacterized protein LOC106398645 isoform X1 n=1 Tax=Brassica napus TaxID=3708 RepID=UPI0020791D5A|nr:uncharacterized protein LOC106398645 isoform X1 [Brassica napus]
MSKLNELQMQEELEGEDGDDYISEEQDSSVESIEESELLGVVNGIGDKTNHNKIDYEKSAAKQESSISVLEKVSGHSSFIGEPMRYSDVRELTFRFMFMVICFFPHVLLLLMQPRVKEKAIQVLPERYPHKHADDLLKAFTGSIVEHARNLETNTHCLMQVHFYLPQEEHIISNAGNIILIACFCL